MSELARWWGIPEDLHEPPIDKPWRGTASHLSWSRDTTKASAGLDGNAKALLIAGCLHWAHARLRSDDHEDVVALGHLAEALVAWQASPRYLRPVELHRYRPETKGLPLTVGASQLLTYVFFMPYAETPYELPYGGIDEALAITVAIVKHVMPKDFSLFDRWLKASFAALHRIAELPPRSLPFEVSIDTRQFELYAAVDADPLGPVALHERVGARHVYCGVRPGTPEGIQQGVLASGRPIDPWAIPGKHAPPDDNGLDRYLRTLDHAANPMLSSPAELVALGLLGRPYRFVPMP